MNTPVQATTPVEVLERTLETLSDERAWTQYSRAKTALGSSIEPYNKEATCFCMLGAVERAARGIIEPNQIIEFFATPTALDAEVAATRFIGNVIYGRRGIHSIPAFNDSERTTHNEVISVLTQALADARKTVA